jgi:hypothetical protein
VRRARFPPRTATATAKTDCTLVPIPEKRFMSMIYEDTLDSFDEEPEMELDDRVPPGIDARAGLPGGPAETAGDHARRMHYFRR